MIIVSSLCLWQFNPLDSSQHSKTEIEMLRNQSSKDTVCVGWKENLFSKVGQRGKKRRIALFFPTRDVIYKTGKILKGTLCTINVVRVAIKTEQELRGNHLIAFNILISLFL